jgi:hypothetical protein
MVFSSFLVKKRSGAEAALYQSRVSFLLWEYSYPMSGTQSSKDAVWDFFVNN